MQKKLLAALIFIFITSLLSATSYDEKLEFKNQVYKKTLEFITTNPNSPDIIDLYFNMGELSIELQVDNPSIVANYYKKVLDLDPDKNYINRQAALYNYALYYLSARREDFDARRIAYLNSGQQNYPDNIKYTPVTLVATINAFTELYNIPASPYHSDVLLRLGNIYFSIAFDAEQPFEYYQQANAYFNELSQKSGDDLQIYGIFYRGWTNFAKAEGTKDFDASIDDFATVLKIIKQSKNELYRTYFETDAMKTIAHSLLEYDENFASQSIAAIKAQETFLALLGETSGKQILEQAINLKIKYNAPMQAMDFYNSYIKLYPLSPDCPVYIDSIRAIIQGNSDMVRNNNNPRELIFAQRERLVNEYHADSEWFMANKDANIAAQLVIIRQAYDIVNARYFNQTVENASEVNFVRFVNIADSYRRFAQVYPIKEPEKLIDLNAQQADLQFYLAENSLSPFQYILAMRHFDDFNLAHTPHAKNNQYEEKRFFCTETVYNQLKDSIADSTMMDSLHNITLNKAMLDSLYVSGSIRYQNYLLTTKNAKSKVEITRVLKNKASIYSAQNNNTAAFDTYNELLSYASDDSTRVLAYSRMGEIDYDAGAFEAAVAHYANAAQYASGTTKVQFATNRLASIRSKADTLFATGMYMNAANEYSRLAGEYASSEPEVAVSYKTRVVESYKKAGEFQLAIDVYKEIASGLTAKDTKLSAYASAWQIADEQNDFEQGIALRRMFIASFPRSNEAFDLEMEIISMYDSNPQYGKAVSAQMLLDLHGSLGGRSTSTIKESDLIIEAIKKYDALGDDTKKYALMLDFEKKYPQHELANEFLLQVASHYETSGEDAKFTSLAQYMYKKNPQLNIYETIAKQNLREVLEAATVAFSQHDFYSYNQAQLSLAELRSDYDKLVRKYRRDGLTSLPYDVGYEQFDAYTDQFKFYKRYQSKLNVIKTDWLDTSIVSILRVNRNTKWKEHLIDGSKRFDATVNVAKNKSTKLYEFLAGETLDKGYLTEIPAEKRTELIYLCGRTNDYSSEIIENRLAKWLSYAYQLTPLKKDPALYAQYKANFEATAYNDFQVKSLILARDYYINLIQGFYDGGVYFDKWTNLALGRLIDINVKQDLYEHHVSDADWLVDSNSIADSTLHVYNNWSMINADQVGTPISVYSNAAYLNLFAENNIYLKKEIEPKGNLEKLYIRYLSDKPLDIWLGKRKLANASIVDSLYIDNKFVANYQVELDGIKSIQDAAIYIKYPADMLSPAWHQLAIAIKLIYTDKAVELAPVPKTTAVPDTLSGSVPNVTPDATPTQTSPVPPVTP